MPPTRIPVPQWRHRRRRTLAPAIPPMRRASPPRRSRRPGAYGDPSSRASLPSRTPPASLLPSPTSSAATSASAGPAAAGAPLYLSRSVPRPHTPLGEIPCDWLVLDRHMLVPRVQQLPACLGFELCVELSS